MKSIIAKARDFWNTLYIRVWIHGWMKYMEGSEGDRKEDCPISWSSSYRNRITHTSLNYDQHEKRLCDTVCLTEI